LPLVIVVLVLLLGGLIWRARTTRRLTMEESVDRYRRTLSAVYEATARSRAADGEETGPPRYDPVRERSGTVSDPGSRRALVVAAMAVASVVGVGVVIAETHGKGARTSSGATTTRPPATRPTTTTRPAPTTTAPLVVATDASKTTFRVSSAIYTLVVQATTGACWIDARDLSGASLFSGTLSPGQSQSIRAGAIKLQLGAPAAVTLSIEGTPVPVSLASGSPLTLQFQGS
jgi:cytoskeleton protein RodZ